jgi:hypothetical protein
MRQEEELGLMNDEPAHKGPLEGYGLAPAVTRFVAAIFAILTVSDYLHQARLSKGFRFDGRPR